MADIVLSALLALAHPLQILDLGITRMLCNRQVIPFPGVCSEFYQLYKDKSSTFRAGNLRIGILGRRSLASFVPPGYVFVLPLSRCWSVGAHILRCGWVSNIFCRPAASDARPLALAQGLTGRLLPFFLVDVVFFFAAGWGSLCRYLVHPDEKQATFTGEQQRGGVWFMVFVVLGLFSPRTKRRPPPKKNANGDHTSTPTATGKRRRTPAAAALSQTRAPPAAGTTAGTSTPAPPTAVTTTGTSTGGTADADADTGGGDVDAEQQLDGILASFMSEIDVADGTAAEAAPELSDAASVNGEASGASVASDRTGDSDDSATRAAAVGPTIWGRSDEAEGKTKKKLTFDKAAFEAAFGYTPYYVAVTTLFVKDAQLVERLTGHWHCRVPMTVAGAEEVGALAKEVVLGFMVPILGEWFSTKVRKLLAHVISAIKAHGAITKGDASSNEALHGKDKRRYSRTSGDADTFRVQMLRVGQGTLEIQARLAKQAAEFDNWFRGGVSDEEDDEELSGFGAAPGGGAALRRGARPLLARAPGVGGSAVPRRAATITVDQLAERRGLGAASHALGLQMGGTVLNVTNSYTFFLRMAWCAGGHPKQHLGSTPMYRGLLWYDGVAYRLPGDAVSVVRYGSARAILRAVGGEVREVVVVSEMDIYESTPGCPLSGA